MGHNSVDGSIFIRLAVIASETRELSRNSKRIIDLTAVQVIQGHWSWCQWKAHMWLQVPISHCNLAVSTICSRFRA